MFFKFKTVAYKGKNPPNGKTDLFGRQPTVSNEHTPCSVNP